MFQDKKACVYSIHQIGKPSAKFCLLFKPKHSIWQPFHQTRSRMCCVPSLGHISIVSGVSVRCSVH